MITRATSMAKDPNDAKHLSHPLYEKYVVVPADNAPNHIVFVCKSHYIDRLIKFGDFEIKDTTKSSLRKFYSRHHDLVNRYRVSVSQMTPDMFRFS